MAQIFNISLWLVCGEWTVERQNKNFSGMYWVFKDFFFFFFKNSPELWMGSVACLLLLVVLRKRLLAASLINSLYPLINKILGF